VSGSGHHSFHWLIVFLVSCEVLFTIAAYDPDCDPFHYLRVQSSGGGTMDTLFLDGTLRWFFLALRSWKGDQMPPFIDPSAGDPFRQSSRKIRPSSSFRCQENEW
jgi:hypothetical protein